MRLDVFDLVCRKTRGYEAEELLQFADVLVDFERCVLVLAASFLVFGDYGCG